MNPPTRALAHGRNDSVRFLSLSPSSTLAKGLLAVLLVEYLALLAGCATGGQARKTEASGFLGESKSLLKPGKPGAEEELLVYRNPVTNWSGYKRILLEPVQIWSNPKWKLSTEERKDLQKLVDSFQATLQEKLSKDYELVDRLGPGVMRVQIALTGGKKSITILKVASKGVPYGSAPSYLWTFITGKAPFVGEASIEFMFRDGETDELLAAGADRRVGADTIVAGKGVNTQYLNSWGDVKYSLDYWTDDVVYRLCMLRDGTKCVAPIKGLRLPS